MAGAHELSGAIMRPSAFAQLWPDLPEDQWPTYGKVTGEAVYLMLSSKRSLRIPTPPPFKNHGNHVVSIAELTHWMAERAEQAGVYLLAETAAQKLLVQDGVVRGVRSGDKGRGREGEKLGNFEPGSDVAAQVTVLADGVCGHLAGAAIREFGLGSEDSQVWALGVKEVWEVPQPLTRVMHTLGWPLRTAAKYNECGGSWIYPMGEDKVSIGFVVGLDYADLTLSVHDIPASRRAPDARGSFCRTRRRSQLTRCSRSVRSLVEPVGRSRADRRWDGGLPSSGSRLGAGTRISTMAQPRSR